MVNERKTENLIRHRLSDLGYFKEGIMVDEQRGDNAAIRRLLRNAGKAGRGGVGAPEFIITTPDTPDFVIIVECKPDTKYHESLQHDQPVTFAVDGALHYARALSPEFNVIAVAASGQTLSELKISCFIHPKGSIAPRELTTPSGALVKDMIPLEEFIENGTFDPEVQNRRLDDLMDFSRALHNFMRDHAKLTEGEKPLLVSGTLIALRNPAFRTSFDQYNPAELQKEWLHVIEGEIRKADIPNSKKENMAQPYSSIAVHPELGKASPRFPRGVLYELIKQLYDHVWPYVSVYHDFDVVGRFYGEFLKYTGGDKKALGIVLTPRHITELFAQIANLKADSRVLDTCCGTGGFLIASMNYMTAKATTDREREEIKQKGLVGVEQQPNMYALAASNMILRGDGKANLYQGSCFDPAIVANLKDHACDYGMINPPYSQKDEESRELVFVKNMLDALKQGGLGIAIVPISCAISPSQFKSEILKHHTLDAVMSMPDELFYPVGIVTCIMVFKAHIPHEQTNRKTWFGYWKNDGFIKTKHLGRLDLSGTWPTIRDRWVSSYRNRDDIPGESVKASVSASDEWCAEAYMATDYSTLSPEEFTKMLKDFAIYNILSEGEPGDATASAE